MLTPDTRHQTILYMRGLKKNACDVNNGNMAVFNIMNIRKEYRERLE